MRIQIRSIRRILGSAQTDSKNDIYLKGLLYDEYNELLEFVNSAYHGITGSDSCLNTKLICINISFLFSLKIHKQLDCLHRLRIDFLFFRGIAVNTYKRYAFIFKFSYKCVLHKMQLTMLPYYVKNMLI